MVQCEAPQLELLSCRVEQQQEQQQEQQPGGLEEQLRQTAMKNVAQRPRRPSGQWKITSVTIEENRAHQEEASAVSLQQSEQYSMQQQHAGMQSLRKQHTASMQTSQKQHQESQDIVSNYISQHQQQIQYEQQSQHEKQIQHSQQVQNHQQVEEHQQQQGNAAFINKSRQQTHMLQQAAQQLESSFSHQQTQQNIAYEQTLQRQQQTAQHPQQASRGRRGSLCYVPDFLSLCPQQAGRERRNSVCGGGTAGLAGHGSRAASLDPQSRPIFSFLRAGEAGGGHRTQQPSSLAPSRRGSVSGGGLSRHPSIEFLASAQPADLKVRTAPVLLATAARDTAGFLAADGSLYSSAEALSGPAVPRTRHRSGSQSGDRPGYTWAGRPALPGTGLRPGAAVTEPQPRDGLALSRDGGFFMPFGNTENKIKGKTRRQLKAEEELRQKLEEEEERERALERQRKHEQRKEKRMRNRTMSVSAASSATTNQAIKQTEDCQLTTTSLSEKQQDNIQTTSRVIQLTEVENMQFFSKRTESEEENKENGGEVIEEAATDIEKRDTAWQQFGGEAGGAGELIGCGKEPVAGRGGWTGEREVRDREGVVWQPGEDYHAWLQGYGGRSEAGAGLPGRWDNVQRGPVLHARPDTGEYVPDRSFLSCSREPLAGLGSTADLVGAASGAGEAGRGRQEMRGRLGPRSASLDTRATTSCQRTDYSAVLAGYSARSRQASLDRAG